MVKILDVLGASPKRAAPTVSQQTCPQHPCLKGTSTRNLRRYILRVSSKQRNKGSVPFKLYSSSTIEAQPSSYNLRELPCTTGPAILSYCWLLTSSPHPHHRKESMLKLSLEPTGTPWRGHVHAVYFCAKLGAAPLSENSVNLLMFPSGSNCHPIEELKLRDQACKGSWALILY